MDIDVVAGYSDDDKIIWLENEGNRFFIPHIIINETATGGSVFGIDLDKDGEIDLLATSYLDIIRWYENDCNQNFTSHTITDSPKSPSSVYAIDGDGDEDIDVLSASYYDDKIAWYENVPGVVSIENNEFVNIILNFRLYGNYPNPFNPETTIEYDVKENSLVNPNCL